MKQRKRITPIRLKKPEVMPRGTISNKWWDIVTEGIPQLNKRLVDNSEHNGNNKHNSKHF